MKNAELKLVRFADADVIATSGSPEIWESFNKALFWDFDDEELPGVYLYNSLTGEPTTPLASGIEATSLYYEVFVRKNISAMFLMEDSYAGSTISGTSLANLMTKNYVGDSYNGIYTFQVSGKDFKFTKQ